MFNEVNAPENVRLRDLHGALKEKFHAGGGPLLDQAGNVVTVGNRPVMYRGRFGMRY